MVQQNAFKNVKKCHCISNIKVPVEPGSRLTEGTVSFLIALNVDMILVVLMIKGRAG